MNVARPGIGETPHMDGGSEKWEVRGEKWDARAGTLDAGCEMRGWQAGLNAGRTSRSHFSFPASHFVRPALQSGP